MFKRLNEQYSQQLTLLSRISESDRAALEYVKSLPGFKEAYPDVSSAYEAVKEDKATNDAAIAESMTEWVIRLREKPWVEKGEEIRYEDVSYEVLQSHTLQADWLPDQVPALYKAKAAPGDEWPEWSQPTGAHDAYMIGDKVSHNGKHWESNVDNNVWEPGVYGWSEVVQP